LRRDWPRRQFQAPQEILNLLIVAGVGNAVDGQPGRHTQAIDGEKDSAVGACDQNGGVKLVLREMFGIGNDEAVHLGVGAHAGVLGPRFDYLLHPWLFDRHGRGIHGHQFGNPKASHSGEVLLVGSLFAFAQFLHLLLDFTRHHIV
jgi:hypothetical protein